MAVVIVWALIVVHVLSTGATTKVFVIQPPMIFYNEEFCEKAGKDTVHVCVQLAIDLYTKE